MNVQQKSYGIRVHGIDIIEKALHKGMPADDEVYKFEIKAQAIANDATNLVIVFISVQVRKTKSDNSEVANIMVAFGYAVEDLKEKVLEKKEDGKLAIPIDLENLLKTVSISTMRGIMFSEFRGTTLHKAILPIVLADSLVPVEGTLVP